MIIDLQGIANVDTPDELVLLREAMVEDPEGASDPLVLAMRGLTETEQHVALLLLSHFAGARPSLSLHNLHLLAERLEELLGDAALPLRRLVAALAALPPEGGEA